MDSFTCIRKSIKPHTKEDIDFIIFIANTTIHLHQHSDFNSVKKFREKGLKVIFQTFLFFSCVTEIIFPTPLYFYILVNIVSISFIILNNSHKRKQYGHNLAPEKYLREN